MTLESFKLAADRGVVAVEKFSPASVPSPCGLLCRSDDVGEKQGDEHTVGLGCRSGACNELGHFFENCVDVIEPPEMFVAWKLDVVGTVDVLGQVASSLDGHELVAGAVDYECRRLDRGQNPTDIEVEYHRHMGARCGRAHSQPLEARLPAAVLFPSWSGKSQVHMRPFRVAPRMDHEVQHGVARAGRDSEAIAAINPRRASASQNEASDSIRVQSREQTRKHRRSHRVPDEEGPLRNGSIQNRNQVIDCVLKCGRFSNGRRVR